MSLHSVEALLDAATDAAVRQEWTALAEAGLPSQAAHQGATNAPHITLSVATGVPDFVESRIAREIGALLPVPVRLGPLLVMGSRRFVLAHLVVPSDELLRLHATVARAMSAAPEVPEVVRPGRWTPHVTLARGLGSRQVGDALAVLGRTRPLDGSIATVRRWDPTARRAWPVGGKPTMEP
ncbi:2'-5' RNA ligase superfamily protein [Humibacillus xanthopallidus]|uniref:2'-5' RNA ligase superfamily protein n=1 Tax=Humibacillus xanthopallidus TaxID=412689 RepID=A0A543PPE9_9MICO|nr:2'-5' RNA ligase family protein [Humibacillus xanthopallidus]TQN45958.1 2'-5' RNA ligase superfamily protein [Humibacillus xanthopallidus]